MMPKFKYEWTVEETATDTRVWTVKANKKLDRTELQEIVTNTGTFANTATNSNFQLVLRNNTDTSEAFVGIAFQAEAGFNADRINAGIFAERVDAGASDVNSDLVFATNNDADDDQDGGKMIRVQQMQPVSVPSGA